MRTGFELNSFWLQFYVCGFNVVDSEIDGGLWSGLFEEYSCAGEVEEYEAWGIERRNVPCSKFVSIKGGCLIEIPGVNGDLVDAAQFHGSSLKVGAKKQKYDPSLRIPTQCHPLKTDGSKNAFIHHPAKRDCASLRFHKPSDLSDGEILLPALSSRRTPHRIVFCLLPSNISSQSESPTPVPHQSMGQDSYHFPLPPGRAKAPQEALPIS